MFSMVNQEIFSFINIEILTVQMTLKSNMIAFAHVRKVSVINLNL